jgi:hypothetical protein
MGSLLFGVKGVSFTRVLRPSYQSEDLIISDSPTLGAVSS